MKIEYVGFDDLWWFEITFAGQTKSYGNYTRRRDAVRGFERFCAAIKGVK